MTVGSTLGRMCRAIRAALEAPSARAAPTYSVSFSASTEPRTIRVTGGAHQRADDDQADQGQAVPAEAPPGVTDEGLGAARGGRHRHHRGGRAHAHPSIQWPPSALMVWPVTNEASSEAKKRTARAISS